MKKLTSLFVVLMLACITVNADVLFQETFSTRRGSTYVEKIRIVPKTGDPYDAWPYPSQWFTGYDNNKEGDDHKVIEGNQYDIDYAAVESYGTSIRNKKLNESTDNTVGFTSMLVNAGEIRNKGIELQLRGDGRFHPSAQGAARGGAQRDADRFLLRL